MTPDELSAAGVDLDALEDLLGVVFAQRELLLAALTHPSFANEHPDDLAPTNERLEFLGDAVLGLVVAEALYARFPQVQEGRLTEWRSALVCGPTLSRVASEVVPLGAFLRLGRGEEQNGGREREGNLERAYEAIVGAVYLDRGFDGARAFVERTLGEEFAALARDPGVLNPKGMLQQIAQDPLGRPEYVVVEQEGPEHDRRFTVEVRLGGEVLGRGRAGTKQEAEKAAARQALPKVRATLESQGVGGAGPGEVEAGAVEARRRPVPRRTGPAGTDGRQPGAGAHGAAADAAVPGDEP